MAWPHIPKQDYSVPLGPKEDLDLLSTEVRQYVRGSTRTMFSFDVYWQQAKEK